MPESTAAAGSANVNSEILGQAYYEKARKQLSELIQKRRELEQQLAAHEEQIAKKEQEYLEETPSGNIIAGFDNYTKGSGTTSRRRGREEEERERRLRVFSRSSLSWNAHAVATPTIEVETPPTAQDADSRTVSATASTPGSAGFHKADGIGSQSALSRKNKKGPEESEGEGRDPRKARVCFGLTRK